MALKEIFEAITPENIKDIPLLKDAMDIFIENLEEKCSISKDIKKIYSSDNYYIKENLLKTYLSVLYDTLTRAQYNPIIDSKLTTTHYGDDIPLKYNFVESLNEEYLVTNKKFKQKVGTKISIEYAYNLAKYLQDNAVNIDDFNLIEIKPFHFKTEGSVYKEIYENIVKPLSHPVGFTYIYNQVIEESILDFFGYIIDYNLKKIEVRCLNGYFDVFTQDSDDTNVKEEFLTSRTNILTGELFTEEEYDEYITVYPNKEPVEFIIKEYENNLYRKIIFSDDTILVSNTNDFYLYYRTIADEYERNTKYIKQYTDHCSLFVDYEYIYNKTVKDELETELAFYITKINDETLLPGISYYSMIEESSVFQISGEEYSYIPGEDEAQEYGPNNLLNINISNNEISIGELNDGSYSSEDIYENGIYYEGNDYNNDIYTLTSESTFIGEGRTWYPIDTSDVIKTYSKDYMRDEFNIETQAQSGYYLVTGSDNIYDDGEKYFYTSDGIWYLYTY